MRLGDFAVPNSQHSHGTVGGDPTQQVVPQLIGILSRDVRQRSILQLMLAKDTLHICAQPLYPLANLPSSLRRVRLVGHILLQGHRQRQDVRLQRPSRPAAPPPQASSVCAAPCQAHSEHPQ